MDFKEIADGNLVDVTAAAKSAVSIHCGRTARPSAGDDAEPVLIIGFAEDF